MAIVAPALQPPGGSSGYLARGEPALAAVWFAIALVPMIVSEIMRLSQRDAAAWLAWDYAGRIAALAVLAAVPAVRKLAFRLEAVRVGWFETGLWVVALVAFDRLVGRTAGAYADALMPGSSIAHYPAPHGVLFIIDISFGLALAAYSEELIFRRCGRCIIGAVLGDGAAMTAVTAVLFAAYHWWTGAGNILAALLFGVAAMLLYRRAAALSPVVLAHYLSDVTLGVWPV